MPSYFARLKKRDQVAEGTMAFHFEKPAGFEFIAGQFVAIALIDPPETDDEGNTRVFSIASAPYEHDLMVATRMRDTAFKRVLGVMKLGTEVRVQGPFGNLTVQKRSDQPIILLAGGIGITPFRSIVFQAAEERAAHRLFLFYSNRRPEDAAFINELEALEKIDSNYKLIATMTGQGESVRQWRGERGFIDATMLGKVVSNLTEANYYVAGPPTMVESMKKLLQSLGVADNLIRAEQFAGY